MDPLSEDSINKTVFKMYQALRRGSFTSFGMVMAVCLLLAGAHDVAGQNVVVNGDFESGLDGWTVYDMGSNAVDITPELFLESGEDCPAEGSGQCAIITGTVNTYAAILIWQEVTLTAGTPYAVEGQFKMLVDTVYNYWGQLYISTTPPVDFQDWTPQVDIHFGFNWWSGCPGIRVDGPFSEHTCEGRLTPNFVPPGTPGQEVTYYFGFKTGVNAGPQTFAISVDDFQLTASEDAYAIADFTTDPPDRAVLGESLSFDGTVSSSSGTITSWDWDFGDGVSATGSVVEHTYDAIGRYMVELVVVSDDGAADTLQRPVSVWDGRGTLDNPLEIPRASQPPVIDGVWEPVWESAQHVHIATRANEAFPDSPEDLSAQAWLLWDDASFYVFFDVVDDTLINDSGNTWQDDAPEIYLDGDNSKVFEGYDTGDDGAWEFGWNSSTITGNAAGRTAGASFAWVTNENSTGYTLELNVPWENLIVPALGDTIGLELMVNDDDTGGDVRNTKLSWFAPEGVDEAHRWAHVWGNAVLVEQLTTAAERDAGLPDRFSLDGIYPNPFNPFATAVLTIREAGAYEVHVYNILGQLVQRQELVAAAPGEMRIPLRLDGHASGTYILRIQHRESGRILSAKALLLK